MHSKTFSVVIPAFAGLCLSSLATAGVCEYADTTLCHKVTTGAVGTGVAAGVGLKAAGVTALAHSSGAAAELAYSGLRPLPASPGTACLHWTVYLSALLTPIIGFFGALIAYRQWHIARNKIKLELYEKRFSIYEATLLFYQKIVACTAETIKTEAFNIAQKDFIKASREAQFLFSTESGIFQLLEEWHTRSFKVIGFKEIAKDLVRNHDEFLRMQSESIDALEFFNQSLKKLECLLTPYLYFKKAYA